ncbi:MAG: hypothetical protein HFI51_07990 [Lachnospiraceae bacterium]|jgi:hypothetical protein|nr:hypothetical protein [Lachnospiraceae bacterium]
MSLKEILKSQGYTEEQIQTIMNAMKENGIFTAFVENPEETIRKLQADNEQLRTEMGSLQEQKKKDVSAVETIKKLQDEIRKGKIETAAIIGLTKAGAMDVDYLLYKAEKAGDLKKLKVDEAGKVSGTEELVDGLKKNYAAQFKSETGRPEMIVRAGIKKLEKDDLPDDEPANLEEAIAQKYSEE